MCNNWMLVYYESHVWSSITVYIDPARETAKICSEKCVYQGCHNESDSEYEESERIVSIEEALSQVFPDEEAIALILSNTRKDYTEVIKQLKEEKNSKS